ASLASAKCSYVDEHVLSRASAKESRLVSGMLRSQARGTADIHGQPVLCAGRRARASPPSLRSTSAVRAPYRAGANRPLLNSNRVSGRSTRILKIAIQKTFAPVRARNTKPLSG